MKVILLQELKGRGGEGDVIDVARGFAVNYLMPRKVAIEATRGSIKQLEQRSGNIRVREEQRINGAESLAGSLEGKVLTIEAKVGEEGRLFGSITTAMIGDAILKQLGIDVDRRKIETYGPIKTSGEHDISVSVYRDIKTELKVNVVPEGQVAGVLSETVVAEAEGVGVDGEPFVEIVEETADQAETDVAVEESVEE
jgi:large subunit ribosomal protein L9